MPNASATEQLLKEIRIRRSRPDVTRLRELRNRLDVTQPPAARFVGCSAISISEWERGVSFPSRRYWKKLNELVELLEEELTAAQPAIRRGLHRNPGTAARGDQPPGGVIAA